MDLVDYMLDVDPVLCLNQVEVRNVAVDDLGWKNCEFVLMWQDRGCLWHRDDLVEFQACMVVEHVDCVQRLVELPQV